MQEGVLDGRDVLNAPLGSGLLGDLRRLGHRPHQLEIVSQNTLLRRLPAIFGGVGYLITAPPSAVIGD